MSHKSPGELQREFKAAGWNLAGANLLAVSCWLAQRVFLYFRPRLDWAKDGLYVAGFTLAGVLTPNFSLIYGALGKSMLLRPV